MELSEYQDEAKLTDRLPASPGSVAPNDKELLVPLLGLAGEAGELLSEYKKLLRDGSDRSLIRERIKEELGDLLWYLSNVATKFDIYLDDIAKENLKKVAERWGPPPGRQVPLRLPVSFDSDYPESERLPRRFPALITDDGSRSARTLVHGKQLGETLTDNQYVDDGYRLHDIFHFAYAAVLGWSPVVRSLLKRKRKSRPRIDEVEDGGRAIAIEEGISAMVFSYASQNGFTNPREWITTELLRTIKTMTSHLEVSQCSPGQWERAIILGFHAWTSVRLTGGAKLIVDLDEGGIKMARLPKGHLPSISTS